MKKLTEKELKRVIANVFSTRPMYLDITEVVWESDTKCKVDVSYRGFPCVVDVENNIVIQSARRI